MSEQDLDIQSAARLANLVDFHRPHALIVDFDIEAADLEAGQIPHQEAVDAQAVERADIAGDQGTPLLVGEIEARQRLGRIGLHGGAEGMVAQHLATQMVDGENRHDAPELLTPLHGRRSSVRGFAMVSPLGLEPRTP